MGAARAEVDFGQRQPAGGGQGSVKREFEASPSAETEEVGTGRRGRGRRSPPGRPKVSPQHGEVGFGDAAFGQGQAERPGARQECARTR